MPESKAQAKARAPRLGFPAGNVVRATGTRSWFIAPLGVKSGKGKRAYADCRAGGGEQGVCAAVSHKLDNKLRHKT